MRNTLCDGNSGFLLGEDRKPTDKTLKLIEAEFTGIQMWTISRLKQQPYSKLIEHVSEHSFCEMPMIEPAVVHDNR